MKPRFDDGSSTPTPGLSLPSISASEAPLALQETLSSVTHEINNPLAVIAGNAQLLLELARVMDLDPDLAKPIRDIEEASHQLAATVGRLNTLKESLGSSAAGGDGL